MNDPLSATMLIPDIDSGKISSWFKELDTLLSKKSPKFLEHYPDANGGELFSVGDNTNGYYYLKADDSIIYFVRYRSVKANGNSFGRQVLVARQRSNILSTGVALHVFFKYLLPRFGALVSDTQQTQHGKAFWDYAIASAFKRSFIVYFLDRRSTPNRLIQMSTPKDVNQNSKEIWGTDQGHLRTHVVISKIPVILKEKHERKVQQ